MLVLTGFAQDPGTLNLAFGDEGVARLKASTSFDMPFALLNQYDGKIVTVGKSRTDGNNYSVYVSRQNADGSVDATYGESGYKFFKADPLIYLNEGRDAVYGENGLLYIAGHAFDYTDSRGFVLCVDENGFEYPMFGDKGYAISESGYGIVYESIAIDEKNRPIVCGYKNDTLLVRRFDENGQLDATFGEQGSVMLPFEEEKFSFGFAVKALPDNKILVAGAKMKDDGGSIFKPIVVRLKENGTLDKTFANGTGVQTYSNSEGAEFALAIAVQPDGKYIIAGHSEIIDESDLPRYRTYVTRLKTNGSIDMTFGDNGFAFFETFSGEGCVNNCYAVTVADDGQIFGTFYSYNHSTYASRAYVFNLDSKGKQKENFAGTGVMPFAFTDPEIQTSEVLLQEDGTLLVSGYLYDGDMSTDVFVASINTDVDSDGPDNPDDSVEELEKSFNIYPNPATSVIYVESSNDDNATINIIDLTGRCVKEVETTNNLTAISTEDINKGVYFITVQQNDNKIVEKLIVR